MWTLDNLCAIHGPAVTVTVGMSCGLYINGSSLPAGTPTVAIVMPIESGLVDREVRCENCEWGGPTGECAEGEDWATIVAACKD